MLFKRCLLETVKGNKGTKHSTLEFLKSGNVNTQFFHFQIFSIDMWVLSRSHILEYRANLLGLVATSTPLGFKALYIFLRDENGLCICSRASKHVTKSNFALKGNACSAEQAMNIGSSLPHRCLARLIAVREISTPKL